MRVFRHPLMREFIILLAIFGVLLYAKRTSLEEPYHWDALSYVAGSALDMLDHNFRLIPSYATGHPPLFFAILAAGWTIFGYSLIFSHLLILIFSTFGLYLIYRLGAALSGTTVGVTAAILTFFNQIFFAQAGTLNLAIVVLTLGLATTYAYIRQVHWQYLLFGSALLLIHQAALLFIAAFLAHATLLGVIYRSQLSRIIKSVTFLLIPIGPVGAWYLYHWYQTGWAFDAGLLNNKSVFLQTLLTNFLRHFFYDATTDNVNKYNWIAVAIIAASAVRAWLHDIKLFLRPEMLFVILLTVHLVFFSWSDDLPRYFLPVLPYFYLITARAMVYLLSAFRWKEALSVGLALTLGALFTTNYYGQREQPGWQLESNLEYADHVTTHMDAARYLEVQHGNAVIVTCWPMTVELNDPRNGYISKTLTLGWDYRDAGSNSVIYFSTQSNCKRDRQFMKLVRSSQVLRRFEKNGKDTLILKKYSGG